MFSTNLNKLLEKKGINVSSDSSSSVERSEKNHQYHKKNLRTVIDKEKDCLVVLYDARIMLKKLIELREERNRREIEDNERRKKGILNVTDLQSILQQNSDDDDRDLFSGKIKF